MQNLQPIFTNTAQLRALEDEIDLRELAYKYFWRYWYLYLLGVMIGGGLAYFYLQIATPVYEIKSTILIREEDNQPFSAENIVLDKLNISGTTENVANEMQLLQSNSLMTQVVNQLGLTTNYSWKYYLKNTPIYQETPVVVDSFRLNQATLSSDRYRIKSGIAFDLKPLDYERFELTCQDEPLGQFEFGTVVQNEYGSFLFNLNNPERLLNDSTLQITFQNPELVTEIYQEKFKVSLVDKGATMLELQLEESLPDRGVMVLSALIDNYNKSTVNDKNQIAQNTLTFVNDRLGELAKELSLVEGQVESFKKRNEIITEVSTDLNIVMQELSKFTDEQTDLEVQLSILESTSIFLGDSPTRFDLIPVNLTLDNASLSVLVQPYNELVLKRQTLLETAKPNNPLVTANAQQLLSLRSTIRTTIQNLTEDIRKKLASVQELSGALETRLKKVPTQERGLLEIKRQQAIKENLYLYLLQKREETALSLIATEPNSKIVDWPAASRKQIKPHKLMVMLGGTFMGLFLPFCLILGAGLLQNTVLREKDLKALTKVPLIGSINASKTKETIVVKGNSRTAISERFRLIRTNLAFMNKKKSQTIMLTSSVSGEGKTFTAINLAMSFAITRKKTILVELDLRKPKLNKYLTTTAKANVGVTNYLVGNQSLSEIIKSHDEHPDFHYITSGPIPHNPSELLSEKTIITFFQELKQHYDVIIVDTPPVGLVSDAFLLNEFACDSIYVVRAGVTKKKMLEHLDELKQSGKLKNLSVLLNGVKAKNEYGYGYGYGGGYGYFDN